MYFLIIFAVILIVRGPSRHNGQFCKKIHLATAPQIKIRRKICRNYKEELNYWLLSNLSLSAFLFFADELKMGDGAKLLRWKFIRKKKYLKIFNVMQINLNKWSEVNEWTLLVNRNKESFIID